MFPNKSADPSNSSPRRDFGSTSNGPQHRKSQPPADRPPTKTPVGPWFCERAPARAKPSKNWRSSPRLVGGSHRAGHQTKLISSKPASSYSTVASELHRRLHFSTDRASVRRWTLVHQLAPDTRKPHPNPSNAGRPATTARSFPPGCPAKQVLLEILDDATRLNTGARLYPGETLLAHFDFLSRTFQAHGLPLALYVDYHSFFYTHNPEAFTQLGAALYFYGI